MTQFNLSQEFQEISIETKSKNRYALCIIVTRWKDCCSSLWFDAKNCNPAYQPSNQVLSMIFYFFFSSQGALVFF